MNYIKKLLNRIENNPPDAVAYVRGSKDYPALEGTVTFFQDPDGVIVAASFRGLPDKPSTHDDSGACTDSFHAFHIHKGASCGGMKNTPFSESGEHFNPNNCPHPAHAGDLPPLLSCGGNALSIFLTDKFTVDEVIGLAVIVHSDSDDFRTQPSGAAGSKIACGIIRGKKR